MTLESEVLQARINTLLYNLGLVADNIGFFYISRAVMIAINDSDKLSMTTKWLYPEVADYYCTSWAAVERSIRTAIASLWQEHPNRIIRLAHREIRQKPTPKKFLALLVQELYQALHSI